MRYPWTLFTILGIWVAIAIIMVADGDHRLDATALYFSGVLISTILAGIGFRSAA